MKQVLIDSDLLLELFVNRSHYVKDAESLLNKIRWREVQPYLTELGLKKISLYLGLSDPLLAQDVMNWIRGIFQDQIIQVNDFYIQQARQSVLKDFESAVELTCAVALELEAIVTHTPTNFDGAALPILSVSELGEEHLNFEQEFFKLQQSKSESGKLLYAFLRRSLWQFDLLNLYTEASILEEIYIQESEPTSRSPRISNSSIWFRKSISRLVRQLAEKKLLSFRVNEHFKGKIDLSWFWESMQLEETQHHTEGVISILKEYAHLAIVQNPSNAEADRLEEIFSIAIEAPILSYWITKLDEIICSLLGFLDENACNSYQNQQALLKDYAELRKLEKAAWSGKRIKPLVQRRSNFQSFQPTLSRFLGEHKKFRRKQNIKPTPPIKISTEDYLYQHGITKNSIQLLEFNY